MRFVKFAVSRVGRRMFPICRRINAAFFSLYVRHASAIQIQSMCTVAGVCARADRNLLQCLSAMPYRHFLFAPMTHQGDDPVAGLFLFGRIQQRGSILFHSTAAQDLQDYQVYVSEESYTLVPTMRKWVRYGTARDYDNAVGSRVTLQSMCSLCGSVYSEGYVFDECGGEGVDLYLRCTTMQPMSLYYHYRLDVKDYRLWMDATRYEFQGVIEKAEWAWTATMSLQTR